MHNLAAAVSMSLPKISSAPRLRQINIEKVGNGMKVSHKFHGAPTQKFVFHDPAKMVSHLNRAVKSEWMHPGVNVAKRIDRSLNVE